MTYVPGPASLSGQVSGLKSCLITSTIAGLMMQGCLQEDCVVKAAFVAGCHR